LKDAVRLLVYLLATVLLGALMAPPLFWGGQWLIGRGSLTFLSRFDFETFFHRSLLVAALILLWPLARSLSVRNRADLGIAPNPRWGRDLVTGFLCSAIPLLCCAAILLATPIYSGRNIIDWSGAAKAVAAAATVPLIEETFFRGLVLGILLKSGRRYFAMFATSAAYSIVHFLKAPEHTSTTVTWTSGFNSIAHAFVQFTDPILVAAGFTTLFLIGWILADARLRTRSLWLPIGLHAGWILTAGVFNKMARRDLIVLPWLGRNLLVGIIPLAVAGATWLIVRLWLRNRNVRSTESNA
jgi:membrane protease YdiL (CAAX protease family)